MKIKQISTEKNIKAGIILSYLTLFINVIISIVYTPILLRSIGQTQYGLNSFVNSMTTWFTVLSSALVSSYIRFASRELNNRKEDGVKEVNSIYFLIFSVIGLMVLVLGVGFIFLLKYCILPNSNYADNSEHCGIILILTILSLGSIVVSIPGNLFGLYNNWKQKFVLTKTITLAMNALQPLCTIPFLFLGCDIIVVVIIQVVFTVINILLHLFSSVFIYGFRFKKFTAHLSKDLVKEILIFSSFIILNTLVDQVNSSADKTILGFMVNDEAKSVAIYQNGMVFKNYLTFLSISISTAFSTKVNEAVLSNDNDKLNRLFRSVSKLQMLLLLFVIGGFATFGKAFTLLWLGEDYEMSFYVALVLFLTSSVPLSENTSIEIQRAKNKHKFRAVLYICIAAVNIGLSILLVAVLPQEYAIWGCLIGTIFAVLSGHWITINIYNAKVVKIDVGGFYLDYIKTAGYALASLGITKLVLFFAGINDNTIYLFAGSLMYISIYIVFIAAFERKFLTKFLGKGGIENI